jgi:short subunit dehydrogenase-like uncharacterized protein
MENSIAIYGAYGHTGKFIISELYRQGYKNLILSGRDQEKLIALNEEYPDLKIKTANINDSKTLDDAFSIQKLL